MFVVEKCPQKTFGISNRWIKPKINDFIKKRKKSNFKVVTPVINTKPIYKCEKCKKTSDKHPELTFKYSHICGSDYSYCPEHLKDHKHKN